MEGRKLDVTLTSPFESVRRARAAFNQHLNHCPDCQPSMCWQGQTQWRALCLEALRLHSAPAPVAVVPLAERGPES